MYEEKSAQTKELEEKQKRNQPLPEGVICERMSEAEWRSYQQWIASYQKKSKL